MTDLAAGEVPDRVDGWVGDCRYEPLGLLESGLVIVRVHRGDGVIEHGTKVIFVVEPAGSADVELATPQQLHVGVIVLDRVDQLAVGQHLFGVRAIDRQVFAMVGDGQVGVASIGSNLDHVGDRRTSIAGLCGVIMQITLDVAQTNQIAEVTSFGGFDLAGRLAHRRRDKRQSEGLVDALFGLGGNNLGWCLVLGIFVGLDQQAVFVEQPALLDRPHAERNVVLF